VSQRVPPLQPNAGLRRGRLDYFLDDCIEPERLLPLHLGRGKDIIAILGVWGFPTPSPQISEKMLVHRNYVSRGFRFGFTDVAVARWSASDGVARSRSRCPPTLSRPTLRGVILSRIPERSSLFP
jgi:hypothetical protein